MKIDRNSQIIEVFSKSQMGQVDKNELKDANEFVREFCQGGMSPEKAYELGQLMSYVIDDSLNLRSNYYELIADVKRTAIGEKATFKIDIDGLVAHFQAKSSSTQRSVMSQKNFTINTDEVSIRPVVQYLDIVTGRIDFGKVAIKATDKMEIAINQRIQQAVASAFTAMAAPNYGEGAGAVKSVLDPLVDAMGRVGTVSLVGDIELAAKLTDLTGFSGRVADNLMIEHNDNGYIGRYRGGNVVKLANPFLPNVVDATELRKDLLYIIPSGAEELRPIKLHFEGGVQSMPSQFKIDSKEMEMRFDQFVGVDVVGVRKLMAVYRDTTLS